MFLFFTGWNQVKTRGKKTKGKLDPFLKSTPIIAWKRYEHIRSRIPMTNAQ